MKRLWIGLLMLVGAQAGAEIIVLEADNYAHGESVTVAVPNLTVRRISHGGSTTYNPKYSRVYARNCGGGACGGHVGFKDFAHLQGGLYSNNWGDITTWDYCANDGYATPCMDGSIVLEMSFASPVSFLQLETSWFSDPPAIIAYDSGGVELFRCDASYWTCSYDSTISYGGYNETLFAIDRSTADISRVVFGGIAGVARIGQITFKAP